MDVYKEMKLHELYYCVLIDNMYEEDIVPYDMFYIWTEINNRYFLEFNQQLDINNEVHRGKLFTWLRNKSRYDLLDELMLNMYNRFINRDNNIDNRDIFFISNINGLKQIINDFGMDLINYEYIDDGKRITNISKGEIIYYVKQILLDIDELGIWAGIYDKLIDDDRIIYLDELNDNQKMDLLKLFGINSFKDINNSCVYLNNNESYILLTYTNTIKDIPATIHELTHYISRVFNKKEEVPILREFPVIFFELYAMNYLKNIGYSKQDIDKIYSDRVKDTYALLEPTINMMNYLEILIENGRITKNEVLDFNKNMVINIKNKLSSEEIDIINNNNSEYLNYKLNSDRTCDICIEDLIYDPYTLFRYYPYIIGHYLGILGINNFKDNKEILTIVKDINENLSNINPYSVFKILNGSYDKLVDIKSKKCKIRDK